MRIRKVFSLFLVVLVLFSVWGCSGQKEETMGSTSDSETTMDDLADARIGVVTGTLTSILVPQRLPDAEYMEFMATSDAAMALEAGKVDAYPTDESVYLAMLWEGKNVDRIDEAIAPSDYGVIFGKGENPKLQEQFNTFLAEKKESGELSALEEKWFASKEPTEFLAYDGLTGENGTLKVGVSSSQKPYVYVKNGNYAGFDIEMLTMFAQSYGYALEFEDAQFASVLTGVSLGTYDLGASGFTITEERAKSVDFSDVYHTEDLVLVIKGSGETKKTAADYQNARVGIATGTYAATFMYDLFPNAEITEYNSIPDLMLALTQGKIDICANDASYYTCMLWDGMSIGRLEDPIEVGDYGVAFKKGENAKLREQMNEFIAKIKENGEYDTLHDKWFGDAEPTEFLSPDTLTGTNGTLKIATASDVKPFVYIKNGNLAGYDIEFMTMFAEEYGYQLDITDMNFPAILAGVTAGTYDIGISGFTITAERAESVDFTDPYHQEEIIFCVAGDETGTAGFMDSVKESFEKTFIREDRWKLIAEGVITTLIISVFAVLGGTALGFGLYMLARSANKAVSKITKVIAKIYSKIVAGTPTLVILMILFYVVFGKANLSGVLVAIIGFILTFGSFVYGQLRLTVEAVDYGQTEAAYALGYNRNQTFFRIILPQAMKMFIPTYSGEIVGLIKATSVVGYIAVNDLTKMGDIIRGNTYEAFFPLIAVAIIYFIIIWIVTDLLGIVARKTEPKRRKDKNILKGVVR